MAEVRGEGRKSEPADEVGARFKMVIGICNLTYQIRGFSPSFGIELASCCLDSGAVLPGPKARRLTGSSKECPSFVSS